MQHTDYIEIVFTVGSQDIDRAADIATVINSGGIYVEDYRDLEGAVRQIAHIDLIDDALLQQDRSHGKIHLYLDVTANPREVVDCVSDLYRAAGIPFKTDTGLCRYEDWADNWKKYFKPTPIGKRLLIRPAWEPAQPTDRKELVLEPGLAFGTGTHETTRLCLELLDQYLTGGETVLDVGCGSGILSIAALLLGAKQAVGVDIDALAVKTAVDNAAANGVSDRFAGVCGHLTQKVTGRFDVVVANIVADVILELNRSIMDFMKQDTLYLMSGIIDDREPEITAQMEGQWQIVDVRREKGWVAIAARPLP